MTATQTAKKFDILFGAAWQAIDTVLPHRCMVSGAVVDMPGALAPDVWQKLRFISDPCCSCCGLPFEFADGGGVPGAVCAACLRDPPSFDEARAALVYDDASRNLILKFKHGDQLHATQTFIPWLRRVGAGMLAQTDMIVPVPLHRWRLLARRYNQAALLAWGVSRACGIYCLPDALLRKRATPSQGHLGSAARALNVKNAFSVNECYREKLAGKTIILIDDVYTTGSTVKECAQALKKAGAKAVKVLTVARVVRTGQA